MTTTTHDPGSAVRMISGVELKALLASDAKPLLLDVRTPGEFESGHIPGSVNIPLDELPEFCPRVAGLGREVVVVCQSGNRATQAQAQLSGAGCEAPRVLSGGINAWLPSGGAVNVEAERWALDRQVRLVAGSLVLAGFVLGRFWKPAIWLSAGIGGGLTFSALTNTCAMGTMLSKLPYNRPRSARTVDLDALAG